MFTKDSVFINIDNLIDPSKPLFLLRFSREGGFFVLLQDKIKKYANHLLIKGLTNDKQKLNTVF